MNRVAAALLMTAVSSTAFGRAANVVPTFPAGGGAFSGPVCVENNVRLGFGGAGAVCEDDYWIEYDAAGTQWLFRSTDVDGGGADGTIMDVQDGTDDLRCIGGFSTDGETAPTAGAVIGGNLFITNANGLTVGHPSKLTVNGVEYEVQVVGTVAADTGQLISMSSVTGSDHATLNLHKSAQGTPGDNALVSDGDTVGAIVGHADDSVDTEDIAESRIFVDDPTPASNAIGGRYQIGTSTVAGTMTAAILWDSLQNQTWKPTLTDDVLITTGGGDIPFLASIVTGPPVTALNGQFLFDIPVSSASPDGTTHRFLWSVDSNSVFEVRADSDGAEGVDTMGTAFYGKKTGAKVFREFCDVISEVVTFSGGGGEASLDTADEFIVGNYSIAVTGEVLVTGTGCATFDVGNTIGSPDVDAYGAAIAVTAGTTFDSKKWTATLGYNVLELQGVRLTGNVATNCVDLSVRIDMKRCIAEVVSP